MLLSPLLLLLRSGHGRSRRAVIITGILKPEFDKVGFGAYSRPRKAVGKNPKGIGPGGSVPTAFFISVDIKQIPFCLLFKAV